VSVRYGVVLSSLLLACTAARAQGSAPPRERAVARVTRTHGKALVQLPDGSWDPLAAGKELRAGQRVRVERKGALELLSTSPDRALLHGADRILLGPEAEAKLAPKGADLELSEGQCFAFSAGGYVILAGRARLELGDSDASCELRRGGRVELANHGGVAKVILPQQRLELAVGEAARVDARGALLKRTKVRRRPKYVEDHEALGDVKLVFLEDFRRWKQEGSSLRLVPTQRQQVLYDDEWLAPGKGRRAREQGIVLGLPGPHLMGREEQLVARGTAPKEVRLGRPTSSGGLLTLAPRARLRISYRLSRARRLVLEPRISGVDKERLTVPGRGGLWTEVELALDGLQGFSAGTPLTYFSFLAGEEGEELQLEVRRILAYVPAGR